MPWTQWFGKEHQKGFVPSTEFRIPFELLYYEAHPSLVDAKRREMYFKTSKGKATLRLMLRAALQERLQDNPFRRTPSQV